MGLHVIRRFLDVEQIVKKYGASVQRDILGPPWVHHVQDMGLRRRESYLLIGGR